MLFQNKAILRLESVDSTNNYAANLLKLTRLPEGTVITAQFQQQGRGQRGNAWESENGLNALFSIVLYPKFIKSETHFLLSKIICVALREVIEDLTQKDVFIKWPNDLVCQNKKVAGILLEINWSGEVTQSAIVGIGINVNQLNFSFPHATSMRLLRGKERDIDDVVNMTVNTVERYYQRAYTGEIKDIDDQYCRYLYKFNQESEYVLPTGERFQGTITGVNSEGRLQIKDARGFSQSFGMKEIGFSW